MEDNKNNWKYTIEGRSSLFDLKLNELRNSKDLLFIFVKRDFISVYKQTILGPIWFVLQPLFTMLVYVVIFGRVANLSSDGLPHSIFYLSGIICWNFFSENVLQTSTTFLKNAPIFGKVYFPRIVIPFSVGITNSIKFAIQFGLLLLFITGYAIQGYSFNIGVELVWLPLLVLILAVFGLSIGLLVSSLTVKYRDLQYLIQFSIQLLMFASPIIFPLSSVKGGVLYKVLTLNPLTGVIECFRYSLFGSGEFRLDLLLYSGVISLILFVLSMWVFNRIEKNFMDTI